MVVTLAFRSTEERFTWRLILRESSWVRASASA
jgi:hypothetical protein